jgi:hypothetical protein
LLKRAWLLGPNQSFALLPRPMFLGSRFSNNWLNYEEVTTISKDDTNRGPTEDKQGIWTLLLPESCFRLGLHSDRAHNRATKGLFVWLIEESQVRAQPGTTHNHDNTSKYTTEVIWITQYTDIRECKTNPNQIQHWNGLMYWVIPTDIGRDLVIAQAQALLID